MRQSEKLISTNNDNMHSLEKKSPSNNCICGASPNRHLNAVESLQGSFNINPDGTQARRTSRAVSKKKDSDQEFFQMTYLALLLPHPQKNKLIEI